MTLDQLREEFDRANAEERKITPPSIEPNEAIVSFNIDPSAIPRNTIRADVLIRLLAQEFGSKYVYQDLLEGQPQQNPQITPADYLHHHLTIDKMIRFTGGNLQAQDERSVPVNEIGFGTQDVAARVVGTSEEATFVARKLIALLWDAANSPKHWSQIEPLIARTSFVTSTVAEIPVTVDTLFSENFASFFKTEVLSDTGFAKSMGALGQDKLAKSNEKIVVASVMEMNLGISMFDTVSGSSEDSAIKLVPHTRTGRNRNSFKISSELPYDQHVLLVAKLIDALRN